MMSRLIAKGIIRSYSMRQRRVVSNCDVCGGLMFNAQRYMHVSDAYFVSSTIRFPYKLKKIFDRILNELQYLDKVHPHHFTLDLDERVVATPFPLPMSICFIHWVFCGFMIIVLHIYYISGRNSLMDYPMIV